VKGESRILDKIRHRRPATLSPRNRNASRLAALTLAAVAALVQLLFGGRALTRPTAVFAAEYRLRPSKALRERSADPHHVCAIDWEIGLDRRSVLFQHPPATVSFPAVPTGPGARLVVAPALNPEAWDRTDGARFECSCVGRNGSEVPLLAVDVSPAKDAAQRGWNERRVSLEPCSRPRTSISLRTTCGPAGDCSWDWAGWGDPHVEVPTPLRARPSRLVLLISLDTLRPDRLSLYGAPRETSPALERLARDGVVFETAVAQAPLTLASHASLLTSTYPQVNGVFGFGTDAADGVEIGSPSDEARPVPKGLPLLAETLHASGWQTAGVVDSVWLTRRYGLDRGFDVYDDAATEPGWLLRGGRETRQRVLDVLSRSDGRPLFVLWHILDIHGPYGAAAPFGGRFRRSARARPDPAWRRTRILATDEYLNAKDRYVSLEEMKASYDEGIAATDAVLGGLFDTLRDAGIYDDSMIVVTSDHGENLLDRGIQAGHGLFLNEALIRVPLVMKLPGSRFAGTRVGPMVRLIDVAPSILDVAGVPPPATYQGISLLTPEPAAARALPGRAFGYSHHTGSAYLRTASRKFISAFRYPPEQVLSEDAAIYRGEAGDQLYDIVHDTGERKSLTSERPEELTALRAEVTAFETESARRRHVYATVRATTLSDEELRRLRALGYSR
jgi:arylsulfatase A-like enzyme